MFYVYKYWYLTTPHAQYLWPKNIRNIPKFGTVYKIYLIKCSELLRIKYIFIKVIKTPNYRINRPNKDGLFKYRTIY